MVCTIESSGCLGMSIYMHRPGIPKLFNRDSRSCTLDFLVLISGALTTVSSRCLHAYETRCELKFVRYVLLPQVHFVPKMNQTKKHSVESSPPQLPRSSAASLIRLQ
jgi:hypothetical protein